MEHRVPPSVGTSGRRTTRARVTASAAEAVRDDVPESRCSAWLAAYALGLAHTASSGQVAVRELVDTAGGRTELLCAARNQLAALVDVDHELRARTHRLLTAAVEASTSHDRD